MGQLTFRLFLILCTLLFTGTATAQKKRPPSLDLPLKCTIGQDCFIQHYVDMDQSKKANDYTCGSLTYNTHSGVDFRIRTLKDMEAGVPVLASADGVVGNLRDGVADKYFEDYPKDKQQQIRNVGLGNVVILNHGDGWSSFYAHMRKGSLTVRKGQKIRRGDILGYVGMSGLTSFPHLHFELRKNNKKVDPFSGLSIGAGCGTEKRTFWTEFSARQMGYTPAFFVNTGFSQTQPTGRKDLQSGTKKQDSFDQMAPAMFFWSYYIGSQKGEVTTLKITGPTGKVLAEHTAKPAKSNKIALYPFVGKKRPKNGWKSGTYRGEITIKNGTKTIRDTAIIYVK
jgi:Peptidase family M23